VNLSFREAIVKQRSKDGRRKALLDQPLDILVGANPARSKSMLHASVEPAAVAMPSRG